MTSPQKCYTKRLVETPTLTRLFYRNSSKQKREKLWKREGTLVQRYLNLINQEDSTISRTSQSTSGQNLRLVLYSQQNSEAQQKRCHILASLESLGIISLNWTNKEETLTIRLYLLTFCCRVLSKKLKILSMFCVRVCWMSRLRWAGNVWKVTTSSAKRRSINMTNSV